MTKQQEEMRKGLDSLFYQMGLGDNIDHETFSAKILSYLHSQGVVIKVDRELPKLTVPYIQVLQGGIIQKHIKNGMENIEELKTKVYEELPQVICDSVNTLINGLAGYVAVGPLINETEGK